MISIGSLMFGLDLTSALRTCYITLTFLDHNQTDFSHRRVRYVSMTTW